MGIPAEGYGTAILSYFESNTTPCLAVWDLMQSTTFRLDHRIQTLLVTYCEGKDGIQVFGALQKFLADRELNWAGCTYRRLLSRIAEVTRKSASEQVYDLTISHGKQEIEDDGEEEEYHHTAEPAFQVGYKELRFVYLQASVVLHGTCPDEIASTWINALLLMAEIGLLCETLNSPAELALEPAIFRENMVRFFSSGSAATTRHAAAHFCTILLQRDFQWEYDGLYKEGIEEDLVLNAFDVDGTRRHGTKGKLLRYEPILQEIQGTCAAQMTAVECSTRLRILESISVAGRTALAEYNFTLHAEDMLAVAVTWWKRLLESRHRKLLLKMEQQRKKDEHRLVQTKRNFSTQNDPRKKKRVTGLREGEVIQGPRWVP